MYNDRKVVVTTEEVREHVLVGGSVGKPLAWRGIGGGM